MKFMNVYEVERR